MTRYTGTMIMDGETTTKAKQKPNLYGAEAVSPRIGITQFWWRSVALRRMTVHSSVNHTRLLLIYNVCLACSLGNRTVLASYLWHVAKPHTWTRQEVMMLAYQCRVAMLTLEPDRDSNAGLPMPFGYAHTWTRQEMVMLAYQCRVAMLTLEPNRR